MSHKPSLSEASVERLIELARAGEQEARDELFKRARPRFAVWSKRRMSDARPGGNNPSDIAQEAALRAFTQFDKFQGTTEPEWLAWLRTILESRAAQSFRDAGRRKRGDGTTHLPLDDARDEPARQQTASQAVALKEQWNHVLGLFHELPESQQIAIKLCRIEEVPVVEAARQMDKTQDAVSALIKRGLQALWERLDDPSITPENIAAQLRALRPEPKK